RLVRPWRQLSHDRVARFWISRKRRHCLGHLLPSLSYGLPRRATDRATAGRSRLSRRSPYRLHALYTLCTPFHTWRTTLSKLLARARGSCIKMCFIWTRARVQIAPSRNTYLHQQF
ncbi:unnamed protein product, partial [Ixodes pacificus]